MCVPSLVVCTISCARSFAFLKEKQSTEGVTTADAPSDSSAAAAEASAAATPPPMIGARRRSNDPYGGQSMGQSSMGSDSMVSSFAGSEVTSSMISDVGALPVDGFWDGPAWEAGEWDQDF